MEYLATCYTRHVILCTVPGNLLNAQEEDLVYQLLADSLRHLTRKANMVLYMYVFFSSQEKLGSTFNVPHVFRPLSGFNNMREIKEHPNVLT